MTRERLKRLEHAAQRIPIPGQERDALHWPLNFGDPTDTSEGALRFVGDDPEDCYRIWREMGVEEGTEEWEWRVQTYIRDKGLST